MIPIVWCKSGGLYVIGIQEHFAGFLLIIFMVLVLRLWLTGSRKKRVSRSASIAGLYAYKVFFCWTRENGEFDHAEKSYQQSNILTGERAAQAKLIWAHKFAQERGLGAAECKTLRAEIIEGPGIAA